MEQHSLFNDAKTGDFLFVNGITTIVGTLDGVPNPEVLVITNVTKPLKSENEPRYKVVAVSWFEENIKNGRFTAVSRQNTKEFKTEPPKITETVKSVEVVG